MVRTAPPNGNVHADVHPQSPIQLDERPDVRTDSGLVAHAPRLNCRAEPSSHPASDAARGPLRAWLGDLVAGLLVMAPVAPTLACLYIVADYSASGSISSDPQYGLARIALAPCALIISWVVLALPYSIVGLTKAERVNSSSFSELLNRVGEARVWCLTSGYLERDTSGESINRAVCGQLSEIEDALNHHRGLCWIFGIRYISLWRKLHTAEALLAYIEPKHRLLTRTAQIRARIADSKMIGATHTNSQLTRVEAALSGDGGGGRPAESANDGSMSDVEARASIGQIQRSIDDLRTDSYAGLLAARNLLLSTSALTGLFLYTLLWLAIFAGIEAATIRAAAGFYLVGALVGLFSLLYIQAGAGSAVDDYGLSRARLFVAPQLSGIAAVMGVVVTAMVAVTQVGSADRAVGSNMLAASFNMLERPVNVLVAAVFAFSPGLVLDRLRRQTEDYKEELRSSRNIPRRRAE